MRLVCPCAEHRRELAIALPAFAHNTALGPARAVGNTAAHKVKILHAPWRAPFWTIRRQSNGFRPKLKTVRV